MITFEREKPSRISTDGELMGSQIDYSPIQETLMLKTLVLWVMSGDKFEVVDAWVQVGGPHVKITFQRKDGRMLWITFQLESPNIR